MVWMLGDMLDVFCDGTMDNTTFWSKPKYHSPRGTGGYVCHGSSIKCSQMEAV